MIRVEGTKIIIELEDCSPTESIKALQNGLIRLIQLADTTHNTEMLYWPMELLSAMMLSETQLKQCLSNS